MEQAFNLFAQYAEYIERKTKATRCLRVYRDGSGCIRDEVKDFTYLAFSNFDDLKQQLEQKLQNMADD